MISCGRDNIRLWRVKDGALRSAPVNLCDYRASFEFTDCCFEAGLEPTKDPLDRLMWAEVLIDIMNQWDYSKANNFNAVDRNNTS